MNRPKRRPRKKQSPSFVYTTPTKRRKGDDVDTYMDGSGSKCEEKTANNGGTKNGITKNPSGVGAKKVVKKLFLNGKLPKRKRSPKQKMNGAGSSEENASDDRPVSHKLETLIACGDDTNVEHRHGDSPHVSTLKFVTDRLQTWKDTFERFYREQHEKGMTSAPVTNKIEGGVEMCIKNADGESDPSTRIVVRFRDGPSDVTLLGCDLNTWKRADFPALMDRVKKGSLEKCDKESCGVQETAVTCPAKKRSKLSLKSMRAGRQDNIHTQKLAPLFKSAKPGTAKGTKTEASDAIRRNPCVAALQNLGNTCFLSSVLQVLRYTPDFVDNIGRLAADVKLCSMDETDEDEDEDDDNLTWTFISHLNRVYKDMENGEGKVSRGEGGYLTIRPYKLMDTIEKLNPMFEGNLQQDAHELLQCLLAYIQDATKAVNKHRKTAKIAPAAASIDVPVTTDEDFDSENMADIVAAAVRKVMSSSNPVDMDNDVTSCHAEMTSDAVKEELEECFGTSDFASMAMNGLTGETSFKLDGDSLKGFPTENSHLTNGWDTDHKSYSQNPSAAPMISSPRAGISSKSVFPTEPEKLYKKKTSSSAIVKAKSSLELTTSIGASKNHGDEALVKETSAELEAHADALSEKLRLLTQSKSDTGVRGLDHPKGGRVTKKRHARFANVVGRNQPGIADMFTQQRAGGANKLVNDDGGVSMPLCNGTNANEEVSAVGNDGNGGPSCTARNFLDAFAPNTSLHATVKRKQTARKSAGNYRLSLNHCSSGKINGGDHDNRDCSAIPEDDVDENAATAMQEFDSPTMEGANEQRSIALANGKSAVVRLKKMAVSDYFEQAALRRLTEDYVEHLFQGSMALRTRCLECEGFTERKEAYQDIGVPVRNERRHDEDDDDDSEETEDTPHGWILAALDDVERLRDDNKYVCETCDHLVEAERSMHYVTLPRILTLHLKRFATTSRCLGGITKINDHVTVPMILPCIQDGCRGQCTTDCHRYELYAVITHTGISISSGHYVAYVRTLPPTRQHGGDTDGSTRLQPKTETAKCAVSVSNSNVSFPSGDADMADPNNNADTNNNVDVAPEALPDNVVAPSGDQSERPVDKTVFWYACDDDFITLLTQEEFERILAPSGSGSPYLLFYHKMGLRHESNIVTRLS